MSPPTQGAGASGQIRVLIVDDSAVVRQVMGQVLEKDAQIRVIGVAADPILAQEKMAHEWPDVIVLDVEMPRMDGITFLRKIMAERPTPVVICSTLTEKGAETTMQALAAGAVGYVTKPKIGLKDFISASGQELIRNVKMAAQTRPRAMRAPSLPEVLPEASTRVAALSAAAHSAPDSHPSLSRTTEKIVAIGTSTGGTQALEVVLTGLPRVSPGIVIVQHMPEKFTAMFASRLDGLCQIEVREAKHGDRVIPGRALVAPGGLHMRLVRNGAYYHVDVIDGPPVNRHKPSVDVLFKSVAQCAAGNALGIIMTGMGDDGARGLREMHEAGARTIAQDEASCVVFGMPREAIKLGAADVELPLDQIAAEIVRFGK
ncbi:chemotaxis response regulator protein-glutamate methylesterase [Massilia sp. W12]|uniref:protein-glutamate methylesterase/protein-glutamine glutaminase n=1 Tax=Massilia sp. W12 TaxID=3126507 RepID=UPI0030CDE725